MLPIPLIQLQTYGRIDISSLKVHLGQKWFYKAIIIPEFHNFTIYKEMGRLCIDLKRICQTFDVSKVDIKGRI